MMSKPLDSITLPQIFTAKVIADIQRLIDRAAKMGYVAAWEAIRNCLSDAQLAWKQTLRCDYVGVHPMNRSGLGVGGSESHYHGADVLRAGWSWTKASDAAAFEADPADTEALQFNRLLVDMSKGLIPELTLLKLLGVGGNHTNTFLRCVLAQSQSCVAHLQDANGCYNQEDMFVERAEFKKAVCEGMPWFVMHHLCPKVWPLLPDIIQKALNTDAKGIQGEIEQALAMHTKYMQLIASGVVDKDIDWASIVADARASIPSCSPWMASIAGYVRANAGGSQAALLHDLAKFQAVPWHASSWCAHSFSFLNNLPVDD